MRAFQTLANATIVMMGLALIAIVGVVAARAPQQEAERQANARAEAAGITPLYDTPLVSPDQWTTLCTADGGAPGLITDEADGGVNTGPYRSFVVTNDNATCIHLGGDGAAAGTDPVDVNTGLELGTGAGCANGAFVNVDARTQNWACTSFGAEMEVRVTVVK